MKSLDSVSALVNESSSTQEQPGAAHPGTPSPSSSCPQQGTGRGPGVPAPTRVCWPRGRVQDGFCGGGRSRFLRRVGAGCQVRRGRQRLGCQGDPGAIVPAAACPGHGSWLGVGSNPPPPFPQPCAAAEGKTGPAAGIDVTEKVLARWGHGNAASPFPSCLHPTALSPSTSKGTLPCRGGWGRLWLPHTLPPPISLSPLRSPQWHPLSM